MEHPTTLHPVEEDDNIVFDDDNEDLQKSLEKARKIVLENEKKKVAYGPQAIALLATSLGTKSVHDNENPGELPVNKVVFTKVEEFVSGLQPVEETHKPVMKIEDGGWTEIQDIVKDEPEEKKEEEVLVDDTMYEVAVGKGLSGALSFLKKRGVLTESIEWGGRNMDKKKSKLVGICEDDGTKEICIERTDEYGRVLTRNEAFRLLSHKFHGKSPGKKKQQKRINQYKEELKAKQMKNSDTSLFVERTKKAQAKLKQPYLVL